MSARVSVVLAMMLPACGWQQTIEPSPAPTVDARGPFGRALDIANVSCLVRETGTLTCWSGLGAASDITGVDHAVDLAVGSDAACVLTESGEVGCFRFDGVDFGSVTDEARVPVRTMSLDGRAKKIAAGSYSFCAITETGSVWCWGDNTYGVFGTSDPPKSDTPVRVSTTVPLDAIDVSVGWMHACALDASGHAYCWGRDVEGQLGPVEDSGMIRRITDAVAITSGAYHNCARIRDGRVLCWGQNARGELGGSTSALQPIEVLKDATQISAGVSRTCALLSDGRAVCWGYNGHGALGDGTDVDRDAPVTVKNLVDPVLIAAGHSTSCAQQRDGAVLCWGYQGLASGPPRLLPERVEVAP